LIEIWQSSDRNNFAQFFLRHRVYIHTTRTHYLSNRIHVCIPHSAFHPLTFFLLVNLPLDLLAPPPPPSFPSFTMPPSSFPAIGLYHSYP